MSRSAFTDAHRVLVKALAEARISADLYQEDVAKRLGKNQSFISNIERGERRVDVIEFFAIARAIGADPVTLFAEIEQLLPKEIKI